MSQFNDDTKDKNQEILDSIADQSDGMREAEELIDSKVDLINETQKKTAEGVKALSAAQIEFLNEVEGVLELLYDDGKGVYDIIKASIQTGDANLESIIADLESTKKVAGRFRKGVLAKDSNGFNEGVDKARSLVKKYGKGGKYRNLEMLLADPVDKDNDVVDVIEKRLLLMEKDTDRVVDEATKAFKRVVEQTIPLNKATVMTLGKVNIEGPLDNIQKAKRKLELLSGMADSSEAQLDEYATSIYEKFDGNADQINAFIKHAQETQSVTSSIDQARKSDSTKEYQTKMLQLSKSTMINDSSLINNVDQTKEPTTAIRDKVVEIGEAADANIEKLRIKLLKKLKDATEIDPSTWVETQSDGKLGTAKEIKRQSLSETMNTRDFITNIGKDPEKLKLVVDKIDEAKNSDDVGEASEAYAVTLRAFYDRRAEFAKLLDGDRDRLDKLSDSASFLQTKSRSMLEDTTSARENRKSRTAVHEKNPYDMETMFAPEIKAGGMKDDIKDLFVEGVSYTNAETILGPASTSGRYHEPTHNVAGGQTAHVKDVIHIIQAAFDGVQLEGRAGMEDLLAMAKELKERYKNDPEGYEAKKQSILLGAALHDVAKENIVDGKTKTEAAHGAIGWDVLPDEYKAKIEAKYGPELTKSIEQMIRYHDSSHSSLSENEKRAAIKVKEADKGVAMVSIADGISSTRGQSYYDPRIEQSLDDVARGTGGGGYVNTTLTGNGPPSINKVSSTQTPIAAIGGMLKDDYHEVYINASTSFEQFMERVAKAHIDALKLKEESKPLPTGLEESLNYMDLSTPEVENSSRFTKLVRDQGFDGIFADDGKLGTFKEDLDTELTKFSSNRGVEGGIGALREVDKDLVNGAIMNPGLLKDMQLKLNNAYPEDTTMLNNLKAFTDEIDKARSKLVADATKADGYIDLKKYIEDLRALTYKSKTGALEDGALKADIGARGIQSREQAHGNETRPGDSDGKYSDLYPPTGGGGPPSGGPPDEPTNTPDLEANLALRTQELAVKKQELEVDMLDLDVQMKRKELSMYELITAKELKSIEMSKRRARNADAGLKNQQARATRLLTNDQLRAKQLGLIENKEAKTLDLKRKAAGISLRQNSLGATAVSNKAKEVTLSAKLVKDSKTNSKYMAKQMAWSQTKQMLGVGSLSGVLREATNAIKQHELALVNIARVYEGVKSDIARFGKEINNVAIEFGSTIEDVGSIMEEWAKTGKDTFNEMMELTRVTELAMNTSSIGSATEAVKFLNSALKQMNLEWTRAQDVLDAWNKTADAYPADVEDMATAYERSASYAHALGLEMEDLNAIVGLMVEKTGQKGEQIGTALRMIFSNVFRPKSVATLESFGIQIKEMTEGGAVDTSRYKSFIDVMDQVSDKYIELQNAGQNAKVIEMAGALGQARRRNYAFALMSAWQDFDEAKKKSFEGQEENYSQYKNDQLMDTMAKKSKVLLASLNELAVNAGEAGLLEVMRKFLDVGTDMISIVNNLDPAVQEFALTFVGLAGSLTMVNKGLRAMGGSATGAFDRLGDVVSAGYHKVASPTFVSSNTLGSSANMTTARVVNSMFGKDTQSARLLKEAGALDQVRNSMMALNATEAANISSEWIMAEAGKANIVTRASTVAALEAETIGKGESAMITSALNVAEADLMSTQSLRTAITLTSAEAQTVATTVNAAATATKGLDATATTALIVTTKGLTAARVAGTITEAEYATMMGILATAQVTEMTTTEMSTLMTANKTKATTANLLITELMTKANLSKAASDVVAAKAAAAHALALKASVLIGVALAAALAAAVYHAIRAKKLEAKYHKQHVDNMTEELESIKALEVATTNHIQSVSELRAAKLAYYEAISTKAKTERNATDTPESIKEVARATLEVEEAQRALNSARLVQLSNLKTLEDLAPLFVLGREKEIHDYEKLNEELLKYIELKKEAAGEGAEYDITYYKEEFKGANEDLEGTTSYRNAVATNSYKGVKAKDILDSGELPEGFGIQDLQTLVNQVLDTKGGGPEIKKLKSKYGANAILGEIYSLDKFEDVMHDIGEAALMDFNAANLASEEALANLSQAEEALYYNHGEPTGDAVGMVAEGERLVKEADMIIANTEAHQENVDDVAKLTETYLKTSVNSVKDATGESILLYIDQETKKSLGLINDQTDLLKNNWRDFISDEELVDAVTEAFDSEGDKLAESLKKKLAEIAAFGVKARDLAIAYGKLQTFLNIDEEPAVFVDEESRIAYEDSLNRVFATEEDELAFWEDRANTFEELSSELNKDGLIDMDKARAAYIRYNMNGSIGEEEAFKKAYSDVLYEAIQEANDSAADISAAIIGTLTNSGDSSSGTSALDTLIAKVSAGFTLLTDELSILDAAYAYSGHSVESLLEKESLLEAQYLANDQAITTFSAKAKAYENSNNANSEDYYKVIAELTKYQIAQYTLETQMFETQDAVFEAKFRYIDAALDRAEKENEIFEMLNNSDSLEALDRQAALSADKDATNREKLAYYDSRMASLESDMAAATGLDLKNLQTQYGNVYDAYLDIRELMAQSASESISEYVDIITKGLNKQKEMELEIITDAMEAETDRHDAWVENKNEELELLERAWATEDYEADIADMDDQVSAMTLKVGYLAGDMSKAGRKAYQDALQELADLEEEQASMIEDHERDEQRESIEDEIELEEEKSQDIIDGLEKEQEAVEEHYSDILDYVEETAQGIYDAFEGNHKNILSYLEDEFAPGIKDVYAEADAAYNTAFTGAGGIPGTESTADIYTHEYGLTDAEYLDMMENKATWWLNATKDAEGNYIWNDAMTQANLDNIAIRKDNNIPTGVYPAYEGGGLNEVEGMAYLHANEIILPARYTSVMDALAQFIKIPEPKDNPALQKLMSITVPVQEAIHIENANFNEMGDVEDVGARAAKALKEQLARTGVRLK